MTICRPVATKFAIPLILAGLPARRVVQHQQGLTSGDYMRQSRSATCGHGNEGCHRNAILILVLAADNLADSGMGRIL